MQFDVTVMPERLSEMPALAQQVEALGFGGLWTTETRHDPFLPLALAASATGRIALGTAIAVAFPRSPMVMAHTAWDLAAQSGGRFRLGLGTQIKAHIRRRFSTEWGQPVARLRDYIQALRAIWAAWQTGEPLDYRGEFYQHTLMTPFFAPSAIEHPHIPIYIAGVNAGLCRLAGELADGFHVHPFHTAAYLREQILPAIAQGAARRGRTRQDVALHCAVFVVTGSDAAEMQAAAHAVRQQLAFYASTYSYRAVLAQHGWEDLADALAVLAREGRWADMAARIPVAMLEEFAVVAPIHELAEQVKARYDGLLDRVGYYHPFVPGERDMMWRLALDVFAR